MVYKVGVAVREIEPLLFLAGAEFDLVFEELFEIFRPVAVVFRVRLERGTFKSAFERSEGVSWVAEVAKSFILVLRTRARGDFWNGFRDMREYELLLVPLLLAVAAT